MKFLIYVVGLRRSGGMKSGQFIWSDKHQKFIYEGRELEMEEFNKLMAGQFPMQKLANMQVSGYAFEEKEAESLPEPAAEIAPEVPVEEAPTKEAPTEPNEPECPAPEVEAVEAPEQPESEDSDEEPIVIPRKTRKPKN
jgi:hypothetical protein